MDVNDLKKALADGDNAQLFEQVKEKLGGAADLGALVSGLKEKLGSAADGNSLVEALQGMMVQDADGDGTVVDDVLEKIGFSAEQADTAASMVDKLKGFFGFGGGEEAAEEATEEAAETDEDGFEPVE